MALVKIAPRLAAARDAHEQHYRRNITRCSCGHGWRIVGHEYDTGGCIGRFDYAVQIRNHFERVDGAALDQQGSNR